MVLINIDFDIGEKLGCILYLVNQNRRAVQFQKHFRIVFCHFTQGQIIKGHIFTTDIFLFGKIFEHSGFPRLTRTCQKNGRPCFAQRLDLFLHVSIDVIHFRTSFGIYFYDRIVSYFLQKVNRKFGQNIKYHNFSRIYCRGKAEPRKHFFRLLVDVDKVIAHFAADDQPAEKHFICFPHMVVMSHTPNTGLFGILAKRKSVFEKTDLWLRGPDLNQRPPGYEPDELPAALPRDVINIKLIQELSL